MIISKQMDMAKAECSKALFIEVEVGWIWSARVGLLTSVLEV